MSQRGRCRFFLGVCAAGAVLCLCLCTPHPALPQASDTKRSSVNLSKREYAIRVFTSPDRQVAHVAVGAINKKGQAVGNLGRRDGTLQAFLWENGILRALPLVPGFPSTSAQAVNDRGEVVVMATNFNVNEFSEGMRNFDNPDPKPRNKPSPEPAMHAFLWKNGAMQDLERQIGMAPVHVVALNNNGDIIGFAGDLIRDHESAIRFLWRGGKVTRLDRDSLWRLIGINDKGQVVGQGSLPGSMPVLWQDGRISPLGEPQGGVSGEPVDMNNKGVVVGVASSGMQGPYGAPVASLPKSFAVMWRNGKMVPLNTPAGTGDSSAKAVNDRGQVVGHADLAEGRRAVLWERGRMYDLNDALPKSSGWVLRQATAINERGQILAHGEHQGAYRVVLLTPK